MSTQEQIESKLLNHLRPVHLQVDNESHMHNVPKDSESHFRVEIVSEAFAGKPLIQRHRTVNEILDEELKKGVHALSIHAMTPEEWFARGGVTPESPPCLGGGKDTAEG